MRAEKLGWGAPPPLARASWVGALQPNLSLQLNFKVFQRKSGGGAKLHLFGNPAKNVKILRICRKFLKKYQPFSTSPTHRPRADPASTAPPRARRAPRRPTPAHVTPPVQLPSCVGEVSWSYLGVKLET